MEEEKIDETEQNLEDDAVFMDKYSRQIGVYGKEECK